MKRLLAVFSLAVMLTATGSCLDPDSFVGTGTVHQGVAPECPTIWHVATDNGRMIWPVEDPAFQQEGLRVRFTARGKGGVSVCMAGTIVEFVSLRKL